MSLAPQSGKGKRKVTETIGFISAFALTSGIAIGSIINSFLDPKPKIESYYPDIGN